MLIRRLPFKLLVIAASIRVAWLYHWMPLDQLIERIRLVPVLPEGMQKPEEFQALVNRWYSRLPPRGLRSCLKRSYLLLDLWSRCGLKPEFHLGIRDINGAKDGHAWLVVEGFDGAEHLKDGYEDAFVA